MKPSTTQTSIRLLGIDGGGTTTEACLAEPGCHILGRATAGPSNAKAVGQEAAPCRHLILRSVTHSMPQN